MFTISINKYIYNKIKYALFDKIITTAKIMGANFLNLNHFGVKLLFTLTILHRVSADSVSAACELSYKENNKLYNYSLATPVANFPHGVLSEDGFYKVVANGTVLWFQLCDDMIFNHDPPTCVDCRDCGGLSHCGMGCSALVAHNLGGYPVCTTIGRASNTITELIDMKNPQTGVIIKMSHGGPKQNCSLAVSVICDPKGLKAPQKLEKVGTCDYATELMHPAGCANIVSSNGNGWGWFGTLMLLIFCLFGAYLVAGSIYRYFHLGIRGIDVIPNLEFWASLPNRVQSFFMSLVRRFRGPSQGYRSSYSPVNF